MKIIIILMVSITVSPSLARVISQSAVSSILQDILSPGNTEKTMQLLKMAASRSNKKIAIPERAVSCGELQLPRRLIASNDYIPTRMASNDYMPARVMVANEMPRVIANEGYARANPEMSIQNILSPGREIKQIVQPNLMESLVLPKEIFQTFPAAMPKESLSRPYQTLPSASNPYLPIASPVSAISPANLPPPMQSRGQFLRKIPIPPPTL